MLSKLKTLWPFRGPTSRNWEVVTSGQHLVKTKIQTPRRIEIVKKDNKTARQVKFNKNFE